MTLVLDAGPLVALADLGDPRRGGVLGVLEREPGPLVIASQATAEVDYLLGRRFGPSSRRAFLRDLASGRFTAETLEREEYATVLALEARYAGLDLGLADCALVVLAARHRTRRILSFDERHFRVVAPLDGGAFTVLPADA